jgi:hypothetical protein
LDKGDFVFALKLPVQSGQIDVQRSDLEAEKKRPADEAAIAESKRRELEEIKTLTEKKKILFAAVQRLEMKKKILEESKHIEAENQAQEDEKPKLAYIPKEVIEPKVSLRTKPMVLTKWDIAEMLDKYSFFDKERNPFGLFDNEFLVDEEGTIIDRATDLMWQESGSTRNLDRRQAKSYVKKLNKKKYAGYSDWRLPTIEELASLLVFSKINGLHINTLFDSKQNKCWSADSLPSDKTDAFQGGWILNFFLGRITYASWARHATVATQPYYGIEKNLSNYVRAVRSLK